MSRPRDPKAADLDEGPAQVAREDALTWEMRCGECRVGWLARSTDRQEPRLRTAAERHNQDRPGHSARVHPRGAIIT